jgi:ectoine hydroxylase-related dioxygenase (phytanoyl-CoA dioxygenase family)
MTFRRKHFEEYGFYLAKNLIQTSDLKPIENKCLEIINKYYITDDINRSDWVSYAVENPEIVAKVYNEMRDDAELHSLGQNRSIISLVNEFIEKPLLYRKIPFRIDVPFEIKELAYWHQDSFYVKGNEYEVTAWIPIFDTKMEHGCLSVMPSSHKFGEIPHTLRVGKKYLPRDVYNREIRYVEMKRYDVLFFSSYLLHSSNLNISNQIRYSIQLRYTTGLLPTSTEMKGTINVSS